MASTIGPKENHLRAEIAVLRERIRDLEQRLESAAGPEPSSVNRTLWDAIETLDDGVVLFDSNDRLAISNRRYREFYAPVSSRWLRGTPMRTVARDTATGCVGLDDPAEIDAWVQGRMQAFHSPGLATEQQLRDGRWLRVVDSRLANGWSIGVRTDITALKRSNEQLLAEIANRESVALTLRTREGQLRGFFEGAANGLSLKDRDGRYVFTSQGFNFAFGLSKGDARGKLPRDVLPDDLARQAETEDRQVLATGEPLESSMVLGTGPSQRQLFTSRFPIWDDEANLIGMGLILVDLTDKMRAERELRASQHLLSTVIDTIPHFVFVKDRASRYILVNQAYANFYDRTVEEMQQLTTAQSPHPSEEEKQLFLDEDRSVFTQGKTVRRKDFLTVSQSGKQAYHDVTKLPLRDDSGEVHALLTVAEDITERREAQLELERYQGELEQLVAERTSALEAAQDDLLRRERLATIGQVTGTVAHELRNPLGTIRSSAHLLELVVTGSDPRIERALARLDRNITRCEKIINELLGYTRMRGPVVEHVAIEPWCRQTLAETLVPGHVTVSVDIEPTLTGSFDRERMAQALANLIQNACQAMDTERADGTPARLDISARSDGTRLELRVSDNGPGVPDELVSKLFEPLYSTRSFGIGLGLPLVKQIVEEHGGEIELQSVPGEGTTMVIRLPQG